jgi:hypothetical protein
VDWSFPTLQIASAINMIDDRIINHHKNIWNDELPWTTTLKTPFMYCKFSETYFHRILPLHNIDAFQTSFMTAFVYHACAFRLSCLPFLRCNRQK